MSTSYYHFHYPITSVKVEELQGHDLVTVFESGANSGCLVVTKGLGKKFLSFFVNEVEDNEAPIRTHFGGKGRGYVVTIQELGLSPDAYLADEYGKVWKVNESTAMDGQGA